MISRMLKGTRQIKIFDIEKIAAYLEEPTPITQPDMTRDPAPIATEIGSGGLKRYWLSGSVSCAATIASPSLWRLSSRIAADRSGEHVSQDAAAERG